MKSLTRITFLGVLIFLTVRPLSATAADATAAFDAANKLYAQGKFAEAASAYQDLVHSGTVSPALYFNLGNAFFKSSQVGRAIAAYRQAERLTPRDPDVRANLQFARNQIQSPTLRASRWEGWLGTLNLNEWTGLSAIALWLTFGLLTVRELRPALARALRSWALLSGLSAACLLTSLALAWTLQSPHKTAVVTVKEATIRNGPFDESPGAFTAHDGAELRVLDRKDDWLQVTDGTRRVGWVKRDAALVSPGS
jgi:tetratricopeptide (TPR) repeat protein